MTPKHPLVHLVLLSAAIAAGGRPVGAEPAYDTWAKVDQAADTRSKYRDKIRDGVFDDEARGYLEGTILPQLTLEANASGMDRMRRRMRDILLADAGDEKTLAAVARTVVPYLDRLARDGGTDPLVAVNATLLLGELKGRDTKPLGATLPVLAALLTDAAAAPAVRVAAAAGVARHVEAARGGKPPEAVGPALVALVAKPGDGVVGNWLLSRALDMLPGVTPQAPPETAAHVAAILADGTRPVDVRVRAAAALGGTAAAGSKVDVGRLLEAIRGLALAGLEADLAAADERAFNDRWAVRAGAPAGSAPPPGIGIAAGAADGVESPIAEAVCRRQAWRLAVLADAVLSEDGARGLGALLPEAGRAVAVDLATALRQGSKDLDANPDGQSFRAAVDGLRPVAAAPAAAAEADAPAAPAGGASPFDEPAR